MRPKTGKIQWNFKISIYLDFFFKFLFNLKSVSVSIITIEGTNCKLGLLGELANKTGGIVNIVNPLKLREEFGQVLEEEIIATNVVANLVLHKALYNNFFYFQVFV